MDYSIDLEKVTNLSHDDRIFFESLFALGIKHFLTFAFDYDSNFSENLTLIHELNNILQKIDFDVNKIKEELLKHDM